MSEANNWKWISSPPNHVRNLVEELRVKGEEGAAEMFKNYVEEFYFKCAEKVRLEAEVKFMYAENKRLKASLEFYADKNNWQSPSTGFALQYDPVIAPCVLDKGDKARKVLESKE